jgi:hypothetical protein
MKPRWDDDEFNTPEEMLVRATFLVCLAAFSAGIILTLAGAFVGDLRIVAVGSGLLGIAALARSWLQRRGKFEPAEVAWDEVAQFDPPPDAAHVSELVRLLRQWDEMESKRGSPAFDPWELQSLRHDIRAMVETDPALEGLFRATRRAA